MALNYKKVSISFSVWFRVSLVLILFGVSLVLPIWAEAAVLYLEPAEGEHYQGDNFIVSARLDTENQCVNTIEARLQFPTSLLEIKDVSRGNSILSLWLNPPRFSNESGEISFSGGIPGGYCGLIAGDPGESSSFAKLIFEVKREPLISLPVSLKIEFLEDSSVLLHDGRGTPAKVTSRDSQITILSGVPLSPRQEWQQELAKDKLPPEEFEILLHRDPAVFEGKYFITFQSQDKQTGIDYYEIKEGGREWKVGEAPYLLEDQDLTGIIRVKAVDKAGNERIAEYRPAKPFPYWIIVLILIIVGVIWWMIKKLKSKNEKS